MRLMDLAIQGTLDAPDAGDACDACDAPDALA